MREILFRGKRTDNGEWVQGCAFVPTKGGETCIVEQDAPYHSNVYVVIPETVGQYTGLTDKNGKKIFEGDIVEVKEHIPTVNGLYEVIYAEVNHCYALSRSHEFHHHYFSFSELNGFHEDCEVIGNIHDNPELLGGNADA